MTDRTWLARRLRRQRAELRQRDREIARLAKQLADLQLRGQPAETFRADVRDAFIRTYVDTMVERWRIWSWARASAVAFAAKRFRISRATVENALKYQREHDRGEKEPGVKATVRAFVKALRRFTKR